MLYPDNPIWIKVCRYSNQKASVNKGGAFRFTSFSVKPFGTGKFSLLKNPFIFFKCFSDISNENWNIERISGSFTVAKTYLPTQTDIVSCSNCVSKFVI